MRAGDVGNSFGGGGFGAGFGGQAGGGGGGIGGTAAPTFGFGAANVSPLTPAAPVFGTSGGGAGGWGAMSGVGSGSDAFGGVSPMPGMGVAGSGLLATPIGQTAPFSGPSHLAAGATAATAGGEGGGENMDGRQVVMLNELNLEEFLKAPRVLKAILFTKKPETPAVWIKLFESLHTECLFGLVKHDQGNLALFLWLGGACRCSLAVFSPHQGENRKGPTPNCWC